MGCVCNEAVGSAFGNNTVLKGGVVQQDLSYREYSALLVLVLLRGARDTRYGKYPSVTLVGSR